MARIRTIKPEFWTHPVTGRLPDQAKWLAVALLNHADDEGYFRADPELVRGAIAPFVNDLGDVRRMLDELANAGWIELTDTQRYVAIGRVVNFSRHQKIDRPSPSRLKGYWNNDDNSSNGHGKLGDQSLRTRSRARARVPCSLIPVPCSGGGVEGGFERWWAVYPTKKAKGAALRAWTKLKLDAALVERMVAAVGLQIQWRIDQAAAGGFVPEWKHPATWLNGACWEDSLDVTPSAKLGFDPAKAIDDARKILEEER